MKKISKKEIITIVIFLISLAIIYKLPKMFININNEPLPEVKLKEKMKANNLFAIMIPKENGDGYEEFKSEDKWPSSDYQFKEAKCVDNNGNLIDNAVSFDNSTKTVILETDKTVVCTIYFDKSIIGILREKDNNNKLSKEIKGDLYRYSGTNTEEPNNYICLNSSNCDNNSNNLYRIIGITKDNNLKVIKNTSLPKAYQWHNDNIADTLWDNSTLFKALNGSEFLDNEEYFTDKLKEKILNVEWNIGDVDNEIRNIENILIKEQKKQSIPAKIGLMNMSDYYFAVSEDGNVNCWIEPDSLPKECKNTYLHISNNGNVSDISNNEWIINRYGLFRNGYESNRICSSGTIDQGCNGQLTHEYVIRPVFYLISDIKLSGEGTIDSPFIINITE